MKHELTRKEPTVTLELTDTRAADHLEITFDFERDGYVIRQDLITDENGWIEALKDKQEVAFIPAWNEVTK